MKGINIGTYGERAGIIHHSSAANHKFLYETSLIKSSKWNVGDRFTMGDGRVWRYAKAGNIISYVPWGLKFWGRLSDGIKYANIVQVQEVGDMSIKVDATTAGTTVVTEDQLRGGYVIIHTHGDSYHQNRGILGNTAIDGDGYVTIYLDAPLTIAMTTSHDAEVFPNPYDDVRICQSGAAQGGDTHTSVAGVPAVKTVANDQYLWLQTWGPLWINPQTFTYTSVANRRDVVFTHEGQLIATDQAQSTSMAQRAGFIIHRDNSSGHGSALIMLQISV